MGIYTCTQTDEERGDLVSDIMGRLPSNTVVVIERGAKIVKDNVDNRRGIKTGFGSASSTELLLMIACYLNSIDSA